MFLVLMPVENQLSLFKMEILNLNLSLMFMLLTLMDLTNLLVVLILQLLVTVELWILMLKIGITMLKIGLELEILSEDKVLVILLYSNMPEILLGLIMKFMVL